MDNWNWETDEAWRWLNNCEYAYNASRKAACFLNDSSHLMAVFQEVYTLGQVDCDLVNWDSIAETFCDELANEGK